MTPSRNWVTPASISPWVRRLTFLRQCMNLAFLQLNSNSRLASIMRNLSINDGFVKNARVQIISLHPNVIQVRLLQQGAMRPRALGAGQTDLPTFYLPRITFEFQPRRSSWSIQRRQFPLRLAYTTTFNSCQDLTLDRVVLDLTRPVFAHGQLYTSLSHVRSGSNIRILRSPDETGLPTSSVVYRVDIYSIFSSTYPTICLAGCWSRGL
jgi:hypothetical protein